MDGCSTTSLYNKPLVFGVRGKDNGSLNGFKDHVAKRLNFLIAVFVSYCIFLFHIAILFVSIVLYIVRVLPLPNVVVMNEFGVMLHS